MKNLHFRPQLAPNDQPNLEEIKYPLLASTKLDGCRLLSYKGELVTRSLKPLQNKQLREKFEALCKRTENDVTLMDGEIYAEGIPFYMISSCFMTQDYTTDKSIKRWQVLCDNYEMDITREEVLEKLKFYMFDCILKENYNEKFYVRNNYVHKLAEDFPKLIVPVQQVFVTCVDEVRTMFRKVLNKGYEGLILKHPDGHYKFGRGTLKEALIFKVKPYVTIDAQIIGVKQATVVDPNAPKTINELGRSVTSKKLEDRIPIERAAEFTVIYEKECPKCNGKGFIRPTQQSLFQDCPDCYVGKIKHEVDVGIGGTEKERDEIWKNKDKYIGRWIEHKGLKIGMKDVPRHCNMIRFREDKDNYLYTDAQLKTAFKKALKEFRQWIK